MFFSIFIISAGFSYAQTAITTPEIKYDDLVCKDHGEVNCSIINPDGSPTCNDGFNDKQYFIYAVSYCQDTLKKITDEQSDLMAKTGCYPPSEMTCTNNESYSNLLSYLNSLGLVNSELGKGELEICKQEILAHDVRDADYKLCLSENNIEPFLPIGEKMILPVMKSIFCPMFYGKNSTYNPELNLCLCDNGYFKNGETCTEASEICKLKYGSSSYARDGNCVTPQSTSKNLSPTPFLNTPTTTTPTPQSSSQDNDIFYTDDNYYQVQNMDNSHESEEFTDEQTESLKPLTLELFSPFNIIKGILSSIASGIKNIFSILK